MELLSDLEIAKLLVNLYNGPDGFDYYDAGKIDDICWAYKKINGVTYIFLRGSANLSDWLKDLMGTTNPFTHDPLGPCHPGFLLGMHELWQEIKNKTVEPRVICGHSLGAGRACILTGMMVLDKQAPLKRICYGEPRPGFKKLADIIKSVPAVSYRNGNTEHHDSVTDVPFYLWPLERYVHPCTLTILTSTENPILVDAIDPFYFHHMQKYVISLGS